MSVDHPASRPSPACCRRDLLAGACLLGLAVGATGCGSGTRATPAPPGPPSVPAGSPSSSTAIVLGPTESIPIGGGTVFTQQRVVVTQPEPGQYHAYSARCTHEGCLVSSVTEGTINCPCHGSRFSITDGAVITGPAVEPLHRRNIVVTSGSIMLQA